MKPLDAATAPADPAEEIARIVQEALRGDTNDIPWADLCEADRQGEVFIAEHYLAAHLQWLAEHGFKVVPPGAVLMPKSDDEAMAMVKAAKAYFDAKKRKGQLVNTAAPRKLILPPGSKLQ